MLFLDFPSKASKKKTPRAENTSTIPVDQSEPVRSKPFGLASQLAALYCPYTRSLSMAHTSYLSCAGLETRFEAIEPKKVHMPSILWGWSCQSCKTMTQMLTSSGLMTWLRAVTTLKESFPIRVCPTCQKSFAQILSVVSQTVLWTGISELKRHMIWLPGSIAGRHSATTSKNTSKDATSAWPRRSAAARNSNDSQNSIIRKLGNAEKCVPSLQAVQWPQSRYRWRRRLEDYIACEIKVEITEWEEQPGNS